MKIARQLRRRTNRLTAKTRWLRMIVKANGRGIHARKGKDAAIVVSWNCLSRKYNG